MRPPRRPGNLWILDNIFIYLCGIVFLGCLLERSLAWRLIHQASCLVLRSYLGWGKEVKDRAAHMGLFEREGTKKRCLLPCHTSMELDRLCNGLNLKCTPQAHTLNLCSQLAVLFSEAVEPHDMRLAEVDH